MDEFEKPFDMLRFFTWSQHTAIFFTKLCPRSCEYGIGNGTSVIFLNSHMFTIPWMRTGDTLMSFDATSALMVTYRSHIWRVWRYTVLPTKTIKNIQKRHLHW